VLADYSVELGRDDPALEMPWSSDDPAQQYYDLKSHPELLSQIPEAAAYPELGVFLARINAREFPLQTAKCDVWLSREILPEEEIFFSERDGTECKFACYVDLLFTDTAARLLFEKHEALVQSLCRLLKHAPQLAASVEFVLRRCYYHLAAMGGSDESKSGFYFTAYVSAFGNSEAEARKQWTIALALLQNALVQVSKQVK
jgi:hypothetical protein